MKKIYTAPQMQAIKIEIIDGICAASSNNRSDTILQPVDSIPIAPDVDPPGAD